MHRVYFRSVVAQISGLTLAIGLAGLAGTASATGRIELNQVVIDAAGGFPFSITAPGNYVLTGPLTVPANTDGFVLTTSEVVFDLNGFSIAGPATCNTTSCPSGTGMAIRGFSGIAHAHQSTVKNGTIRGFGDTCLRLGRQARVHDLLVTECGRNGISVAGGGVITNNRVLQVGERGILMSTSSTADSFGFNTVASANLGGGSFFAFAGGRAVSGNSCDDNSCSARGERRFYLEPTIFNAAAAPGACDAGFHMASMWEILDPSELLYDVTRGRTGLDTGSGPPTVTFGWIRTGLVFGGAGSSNPGTATCDGYTSSSGVEDGTAAVLHSDWDVGSGVESRIPWWRTFIQSCSTPLPVWCVEN